MFSLDRSRQDRVSCRHRGFHFFSAICLGVGRPTPFGLGSGAGSVTLAEGDAVDVLSSGRFDWEASVCAAIGSADEVDTASAGLSNIAVAAERTGTGILDGLPPARVDTVLTGP